jgi:uncharacterized protein (DUF2336 family)
MIVRRPKCGCAVVKLIAELEGQKLALRLEEAKQRRFNWRQYECGEATIWRALKAA